jgi:choline dehydrogenase-like flavoprotein
VEYTNDIISKPNSDQALVTAKASKLVVVSAGAFGSPTILERSGIGAKKVLEAAGVQQLVELPGVGENYQGKIHLLSMTYHNLFIWNSRPQCGLCPIPCGW